jgi:DNA-binding CsgD family transcriptional regulator/Flp pilus assembly protein TadD
MEGSGAQLLERDTELAALTEAVAQATSGRGGVALVEGPAGIGKSSLLSCALDHARRSGLTTGRARGSELETDFAFGVVRQLYEPLVEKLDDGGRAELFTGAASVVRPLVDVRFAGDADGPIDPHAALHGLYWLTVGLAAASPVVLAVDDLHWADPPSLRFLAYLANRVEELPVLVLLGTRPVGADAPTEVIATMRAQPATSLLRLRPLSEPAVAAAVTAELGSAHPDFTASCWTATKGNPLLVRELISRLRDDGVEPSEHEAPRVQEVAPDSAARWVGRWLRQVPEAAAVTAGALAVLGDRADLDALAAVLGITRADAASAVDELRRAELLDPHTLGFTHPLVRSAVYDGLGPTEQGRLHRAAAEVLARTGAPEEEVGLHLVKTPPAGDPEAARALCRCARRAYRAGALDVAVRYLDRAWAEPPGEVDAVGVLVERGRTRVADADMGGYDDLRAAMVRSSDPVEQARVALQLGRSLMAWLRMVEAAEVVQAGLRHLGDREPELREQLEATLFIACVPDFRLHTEALNRRVHELVHRSDQVTDPLMLAALAVSASARNPPGSRAVALAERALADPTFSYASDPLGMAAATIALLHVGRLRQADDVWSRVIADPRNRGSVAPQGFSLTMRALIMLRVGQIPRAESYAGTALERLMDTVGDHSGGQLTSVLPFIVWARTEACLERGALDEASTLLTTFGLTGDVPNMYGFNNILEVRGRLRAAQNRPAEALVDLRECGRRYEQDGVVNPAVCPWRTTLSASLLAMGEREEALEVIDVEIAHARAFEVPRELGMALRAAGVVRGGDAGIDQLREAVAVLETSHARLEHARALCDLGAALRRAGHRTDARNPLRDAVDLAQHCGATALVSRGHDELVATGARPRRLAVTGVESLTTAERRVADLAAEGLTNRDIAQALFVTEKTVEGHLGHAFVKLGLTSRSQLARVLGTRTAAVAS